MTLRNCLHLTYEHNANRYIERSGRVASSTEKWIDDRRKLIEVEKKEKDSRDIPLDSEEPLPVAVTEVDKQKRRRMCLRAVRSYSDLKDAEDKEQATLLQLLTSLPSSYQERVGQSSRVARSLLKSQDAGNERMR